MAWPSVQNGVIKSKLQCAIEVFQIVPDKAENNISYPSRNIQKNIFER